MIIISSLCPAFRDDTDLVYEHLVNDSIFPGMQFVNLHNSCRLKPLMVDSTRISLMLYTATASLMENIVVLHNNNMVVYKLHVKFSVTNRKL